MEQVKVLIVVDTQIDFESGSLATSEAQATVPAIIEKINTCGQDDYLIIETRDTHDGNYLNTNEGKHLPIKHTIICSRGWDTVPSIRIALDKYKAVDVLKDRFGCTDLPQIIKFVCGERKDAFVKDDGSNLKIELVGWCTDICVISNALLLKAFFPEAEIIVDSKCCAGVTPELHNAALAVMQSCQITVI